MPKKEIDIPSTGLQPQVWTVLATPSVTAQFLCPTLTSLMATSAAVHAALITSAWRPVTGSAADAPTTIVSAVMAANPSI